MFDFGWWQGPVTQLGGMQKGLLVVRGVDPACEHTNCCCSCCPRGHSRSPNVPDLFFFFCSCAAFFLRPVSGLSLRSSSQPNSTTSPPPGSPAAAAAAVAARALTMVVRSSGCLPAGWCDAIKPVFRKDWQSERVVLFFTAENACVAAGLLLLLLLPWVGAQLPTACCSMKTNTFIAGQVVCAG